MTHADDPLREFKTAVFDAGVSPGRAYVQYFADVMRWPVDTFTSRTASGPTGLEHQVAWLKGGLIGHASYRDVGDDTPVLDATVRPISSIVRAELGAQVRDSGFTQTVTRSMTIHFTTGGPLQIDPLTYAAWGQQEGALAFINAVVDALADVRNDF